MRISLNERNERSTRMVYNIDARRRKAGISIATMCKALGISVPALYARIGTPDKPGNTEYFRLGELYDLANLLNTTVEDLINHDKP